LTTLVWPVAATSTDISIGPPFLAVCHKDFPIIADIRIMHAGYHLGRNGNIIDPAQSRLLRDFQ
jgi:hypothetical protein